jgi:peptide/nickel transport system permease protein
VAIEPTIIETAQREPVLVPGRSRTRRAAAHPVLRLLAGRIGAGLLTLFVASVLIYGAVLILPGDVVEVVLGKEGTPERIAAVKAELNLDQSPPERYFHWLGGMLTGDLGASTAALVQGQTVHVASAIGKPMANSLILAAITIAVFIPLCLVLATFTALRAGRASDHAVSLISLALGSMPEFLIGTLLIVIFFSNLGLLPAVSSIGPGQSPLSQPDALVLPVLTLLMVGTAFGIRLLRASIVEVLRDDYVTMARLNGVRERRVVARYVLRNAMAPSVQVVAQTVQYLVGGIIITESLFNYPGIGNMLVQSVLVQDVQMVSVIAILLAAIYIAVNIVADLAVVFLVPRLRTNL